MGRREILYGYKLSTAQSLAASFQTSAVTIGSFDTIGINIATSAVTANTGAFGVQHRIKKNDDSGNQSAWASVTLTSTPTLANANITTLTILNQLPPGEIRVTFTPAGGGPNGTADIWISGCSVGA